MKTFLIALILISASTVEAQVTSSTARRVRGGNTPPATCKATAPADVFIDTDAAAGSRLLVCTSANTWTAQGGSSGITNSASANVLMKSDGTNAVASRITDNGTNIQLTVADLEVVRIGGATNAFPAFRKFGADLQFVLADSSAFANIKAATAEFTLAVKVPTTKLLPVAFANLPTGEEGMMAWVNDSSTATWGATIAGGGANKVLAVFNGTVWTVAAK